MNSLSLISAVNNEEVLQRCLFRSPDVQAAEEVILQRGYRSAAVAYNQAIEKATGDVLIFVHQDVYLPPGWLANVEKLIEDLSKRDPDWGVIGVWGRTATGEFAGHLYWNPDGVNGSQGQAPREIETLDEVVLIMRKSRGLRFDEKVPGFHMYGSDICLEARRRGLRCYAISALCIHDNNQYGMLPWDFWKAYFAMRSKWASELPINTTCTEITRLCWPMIRWNVVRAINLMTGRDPRPVKRTLDPASLYLTVTKLGN